MRPYHHTSSSSDSNNLFLAKDASETSQLTLPLVPSVAAEPLPPVQLPNVNHQCIATLTARNSYTSSLVLDGQFIFTGSSNNEIRVRDQSAILNIILTDDNGSEEKMVVAGEGSVKAILVSSNRIFSAHQDRKIRVWKINTVKNGLSKLATLPTLRDRAVNYLWSMPRNNIHVRREQKTRTLVHHVDTVSALALSKDGSLLYSVSWDKTIKIWRTRDFKCLESIVDAHEDAINDVAVSNDEHIYTVSSDKKIKVWGKKKSEKKHILMNTLEEHGSGVNALRLSTEGIMFSGDCDGVILVWKTGGNAVVVGALKGHTGSILCLATGSGFLCSGSEDKTVRVWKRVGEPFSCLAVLEGHKESVKCIAMAPEPTSSTSDTISTYLLYSASLDCDIKVWRILFPTDFTMSNNTGL